ncbi:MAG: hypothetical protein KDA28_09445 [Phycisphaerales bacterium]|nr:hypothetical protein [Phycisphaerales bacterium]
MTIGASSGLTITPITQPPAPVARARATVDPVDLGSRVASSTRTFEAGAASIPDPTYAPGSRTGSTSGLGSTLDVTA